MKDSQDKNLARSCTTPPKKLKKTALARLDSKPVSTGFLDDTDEPASSTVQKPAARPTGKSLSAESSFNSILLEKQVTDFLGENQDKEEAWLKVEVEVPKVAKVLFSLRKGLRQKDPVLFIENMVIKISANTECVFDRIVCEIIDVIHKCNSSKWTFYVLPMETDILIPLKKAGWGQCKGEPNQPHGCAFKPRLDTVLKEAPQKVHKKVHKTDPNDRAQRGRERSKVENMDAEIAKTAEGIRKRLEREREKEKEEGENQV